ncbi:MAG TPA: phosphoribosylpyrophosphate synthetase [Elusimicrobia bacterium]|nr:phosphoribosylpyrophosphate synthetase [Elusimicrobiota bacterium]
MKKVAYAPELQRRSDDLKIFTGNAHPKLAEEICETMQVPLGKAYVGRFADGEVEIKIEENVRGKDCFLIQPTCPPVNENLMELLIMIDAMLRASARRITVVLPYYGYGRQDRKAEPRVPISAKLVAKLITIAGANRVLALDLHAGQIQGFFDIPVDNLFAMPVILKYFQKKKLSNPTVVAPDPGGVERARAFAKRLNAGLAIIDKRRPRPNEAAVMHVIGEVKGKEVIILDDMVDTGGTLLRVAEALEREGTKKIYTACSHGVLSGNATQLIEASSLEELVITDSIPLNKEKQIDTIKILSIAKLLGEAILRIHREESVSALFV